MLNISVIVNTVAVIIGSLLGLFGGKLLKERYRKVFFQVIGLLTMGLGISMFLDTNSVLVVLGSLIVGGAVGEFFDIEEKIGRLVGKRSEDANFVKGFITASVLFVAGPVTVIGSLRAGLSGENELIYIKSLMDGISSVMLAATLGKGVLLSAAAVYLVQGGLVSLAGVLCFLQTPQYMGDFSGVGGLMLLGLGIRLLEIKEIKVGNFLPALILSPIFTWVSMLFT
ncbi:membrane protein [Mesotoga sp. Brook.08.YT.4.2.5.1]|jgi:hypothetical protein|uniref:DUF554 domain-containing protein n=1 Tax=unclassified Mesotoga TaxID=1184398 RepID=UPI000C1A7727|nr:MULTISPECIES: DUF554 domain-containing protein [unclassified Mesotoga]RAM58653.1 membrane protein [Mesotoga sp. SC_4PWL113PWK15]PNE19961.1 membrane protein [Mesotoga sp. Brook.08.YT.4.2.5.1]PVD17820.1 membrane protein [Mesotoga sp. Brook.08.105.5.1]RAO96023.1 membrane protein [Mesotoga sp. Brook.08.YT.4.2.5.4.]RDI93537.1 membrane protein [Mesotoga sp. Brook.08.YT.4.2.5.2.]